MSEKDVRGSSERERAPAGPDVSDEDPIATSVTHGSFRPLVGADSRGQGRRTNDGCAFCGRSAAGSVGEVLVRKSDGSGSVVGACAACRERCRHRLADGTACDACEGQFVAGLPYLVQPVDADSVADVFDIRLCSDCYVDVAGSNGPPVFDEPGGPLDDPGDENGE